LTRGAARPRRWALALLLVPIALAPVACGGEKEFTPEEFVEAMNDNGATLTLGEVLTTNPDGIDVHQVAFAETAPSATGAGSNTEGENGNATLLVFDGADEAEEEFGRCEGAPSLTCFRAANAVLRVENLQPSDRARITTAIEGVGDDD
jgi:hypothetical protein